MIVKVSKCGIRNTVHLCTEKGMCVLKVPPYELIKIKLKHCNVKNLTCLLTGLRHTTQED